MAIPGGDRRQRAETLGWECNSAFSGELPEFVVRISGGAKCDAIGSGLAVLAVDNVVAKLNRGSRRSADDRADDDGSDSAGGRAMRKTGRKILLPTAMLE
jgi:hypothetical protein